MLGVIMLSVVILIDKKCFYAFPHYVGHLKIFLGRQLLKVLASLSCKFC